MDLRTETDSNVPSCLQSSCHDTENTFFLPLLICLDLQSVNCSQQGQSANTVPRAIAWSPSSCYKNCKSLLCSLVQSLQMLSKHVMLLDHKKKGRLLSMNPFANSFRLKKRKQMSPNRNSALQIIRSSPFLLPLCDNTVDQLKDPSHRNTNNLVYR